MRKLLSCLMIVGLIFAGGCLPFEIPFSKSSSEAQQVEKEKTEKKAVYSRGFEGRGPSTRRQVCGRQI